jgi:hypothetical protein
MESIAPYLTASAPYVMATVISGVLAIAEIVTVFENDPMRALRTRGAAILVLLNIAFVLTLLYIVYNLGGTAAQGNRILTALGVAFGLPTLLKTRFTLIKPLPGSGEEGIAISLDELYGRLQRFCRRQIDQSLAEKRVQLVEDAMNRLDLAVLETRLRLFLEGGLTLTDSNAATFVDRILAHPTYSEEKKRMLLAFGILNYGGHRTLNGMLRGIPRSHLTSRRRPKKFALRKSSATEPGTSPPEGPEKQ